MGRVGGLESKGIYQSFIYPCAASGMDAGTWALMQKIGEWSRTAGRVNMLSLIFWEI
jgi:hypothetical protein